MSDISVTAASVADQAYATVKTARFGETMTAGMTMRLDANGAMWKAIANDAAKVDVRGITLCGGSAGQLGSYVSDGPCAVGGTVVVGMLYVVSTTAGGFCAVSDLASGSYLCPVGKATTTGIIDVKCEAARPTAVVKAAGVDVALAADVV